MKTIGEIYAANLKQFRGKRKQLRVALDIGISLAAYQRMEKKGTLPKSPATTTAIAKYFDVTEARLFSDPELAIEPSFDEALAKLKNAYIRDVQKASRIGSHATIDSLSMGGPALERINAAAVTPSSDPLVERVRKLEKSGRVDLENYFKAIDGASKTSTSGGTKKLHHES